jgi:hypothetical protein
MADSVDEDRAELGRLASDRLDQVVAETGMPEAPHALLAETCARLRAGLESHDWQHDLLAVATRVDPRSLPADDEEFWLSFAVRVVHPPGHAAHGPADDEAYADWHALSPADWLGVGEQVLRRGPGAAADADALADYAAQSRSARALRGHDVTSDSLAARFRPADVLWRALGGIDREAQLTQLGAWGIPAALLRAWRVD